jgi:5-methylcytosine-specific restriction endonuclease McrA
MDKGTLDHILPRSYSGASTWENVVTACQPCNTRKGNNPNILPKKLPYKPNIHELTNKRKKYPVQLKNINWNRYLNWPEDLIKVA